MNHCDTPEFDTARTPAGALLWDRRRTPRLAATESRLWLGWRTDRDFFVTGAALLNISQGGALLVADQSPPTGQTVWLRLEGPTPIEDVCAFVIEATPICPADYEIRITFREPFPPEFYQAAVDGLEVMHDGSGDDR